MEPIREPASATLQVSVFIIFLLIWFGILFLINVFEEPNWVRWSAVIIGILFAYLSVPAYDLDTHEELRERFQNINSIAFTIATVSLGMTYLLQSKSIESDDVRQFFPLILIAFVFSVLSVAVYNGKYLKYQFLITSITINLAISSLILAVFFALHSLQETNIEIPAETNQ